ncbi:MAG TPA: hypothetical protein PLP01_05135 [Phycisphaerae bacterium]|nr:hypothetical protein [Phycisphaerae bacterium]
MDRDAEHLNLLSIFTYIYAGLMALTSCVAIIYVGLGIAMIAAPQTMGGPGGESPPEALGWIFILLGGFVLLLGWTIAALIALAGRNLRRRSRYWYCFVMACLMCLSVPMGTVLGVFTILVLCRPTVKTAFGLAA